MAIYAHAILMHDVFIVVECAALCTRSHAVPL
jgi:hypothetical protein